MRGAVSKVPEIFSGSSVPIEHFDFEEDAGLISGADFFCDESGERRATWGDLSLKLRVCENSTFPAGEKVVLGFPVTNPTTAQASPKPSTLNPQPVP